MVGHSGFGPQFGQFPGIGRRLHQGHSNADKQQTKNNSKYRHMNTVNTDEWQINLLSLFDCCLSAFECTSAAAGLRLSCTGRCDGNNSEADSLGSEGDKE